MGEVYLAVHRRLGRRVAIKFLLPQFSASSIALSRLFDEARASSLIEHPGIVQVFDCDVHSNGRAFIVMEYLHGESLGRAIKRLGSLRDDLPTAVTLVARAAGELAAAPARGIVHRDLKPENAFLVETPESPAVPQVKALDFGIAKLLGTDGDLVSRTRSGGLVAPPLYMSPEQSRS